MDALLQAVSVGSMTLNLSAAVQPVLTQGDAVAAANWAFTTLQANCVVSSTLVVAPAAAAYAVSLAAQVPDSFVLARQSNVGPRVFTLPLRSWTAPFEWKLWAVTGAFVLHGALWHCIFQRMPLRQLPLSVLGFHSLHAAATPAARVHATAFCFNAALLLVQYIAAAVTLRSSGALFTTDSAAGAPSTVCTLNATAYLNQARYAFPGAGVVPVPSVGAALAALALPASCQAALLTESDVAFNGACAAVSMQRVGSATMAPLALSLQGTDVGRAMSVLLTGALAPGGLAYPAPGLLTCPSTGQAPSGWQPTTLRELSGIFLLQGAAVLAAALVHVVHLTHERIGRTKKSAPQGTDVDGEETHRHERRWCCCLGDDDEEEEEEEAAETGAPAHADVELATVGPLAPAHRKQQQQQHRSSPSPVRTSDALRASVARMAGAGGEGRGGQWHSNPVAEEEDHQRNAVLAQLRSDLLAAEARQPVVARSVVAPRPPGPVAAGRRDVQPRSAPGSSIGVSGPRGRPMMPRDYATDVDMRL